MTVIGGGLEGSSLLQQKFGSREIRVLKGVCVYESYNLVFLVVVLWRGSPARLTIMVRSSFRAKVKKGTRSTVSEQDRSHIDRHK